MAFVEVSTVVLLLGLVGWAVVSDLRRHRIPNILIVLGLALGLVGQVYAGGFERLGSGMLSGLIGFAVFIPLYALGGMAGGDVKLMTMVGAFLTPHDALWAAIYSLIAGSLCGFLILLVHGQVRQTIERYWLILMARAYLVPAAGEVAGRPFPYSVAILLGTLTSVYSMFASAGV